jgi:hypothetical protein
MALCLFHHNAAPKFIWPRRASAGYLAKRKKSGVVSNF